MMSARDFWQLAAYISALLVLAPILGRYMARVFRGERTILHPAVAWIERLVYRVCGVRTEQSMHWKEYAGALLIFNGLGFVVLFLMQMIQRWLPLNPENLANVSWNLSFNTAVSFMTNTNWQSYAGETTLSYLTQMIGLTVQNFVSAGTGIAVMLALIRGLTRRLGRGIGNFWVDLTRSVVYVLLPFSVILAVALVTEGVPQTFSPSAHVTTLEGQEQVVPLGPAASQIAIKQLGTNGGGFYNANSAHPLENPTPISNFLEMLSILLLPASLVFTYGRLVGSRRQGWLISGVMLALFLGGLALSLNGEFSHNAAIGTQANMEGKEIRFGIVNSVLWAMATTAASNGSVNAMHSSLSPLAGGVALFNIMLGEIIFGGVGAGLYGMLMFVLLTVFLSGLMVGRTPEYLGKKIEVKEIRMVMLAVLAPCAVILVGSGIASVLPVALSSLTNRGPHGLSEILYAYSSGAGNNGSAFAGLNANTVFYNVTLGIAMLIGRFAVIIPSLAIAGSLVIKNVSPPSAGTLSTTSITFAVLLIGVILIVGALTFLPALSLGPIIEHLMMVAGRTF
jgi:K+-transporting ATPase ATPase A chain